MNDVYPIRYSDLTKQELAEISQLAQMNNYIGNLQKDMRAGALLDNYASTALKFAFDLADKTNADIRKAILDNKPLTKAQRQRVFDYLVAHDNTRVRSGEKGTVAGNAFKEDIVDSAIETGRKAYEMSEDVGPEVSFNYKGDWIDSEGNPQKPVYFQDQSKYRALSSAHRELDQQFETLLGDGVLTLPQVRMLRSVTAAMEPHSFRWY